MSWIGNTLLPAIESVVMTDSGIKIPKDSNELASWLSRAGMNQEARYIQNHPNQDITDLLNYIPGVREM
jgi:hypothetical protein